MKLSRPDLAAYVLVGVCIVGMIVLAVLGKPIPEVMTYLAVTALGAGAGVAVQGSPGAAPAPAAAPAAFLAAAPPAADPQTGIIPRIATHAP